jgi:hypothetical protein
VLHPVGLSLTAAASLPIQLTRLVWLQLPLRASAKQIIELLAFLGCLSTDLPEHCSSALHLLDCDRSMCIQVKSVQYFGWPFGASSYSIMQVWLGLKAVRLLDMLHLLDVVNDVQELAQVPQAPW